MEVVLKRGLEITFIIFKRSLCNPSNFQFSGDEMGALKKVSWYNKSLIDEAEDDIDRLLLSEGIY